MQDEFMMILDEYDALLLKAEKSEADLRRIRHIEAGAMVVTDAAPGYSKLGASGYALQEAVCSKRISMREKTGVLWFDQLCDSIEADGFMFVGFRTESSPTFGAGTFRDLTVTTFTHRDGRQFMLQYTVPRRV